METEHKVSIEQIIEESIINSQRERSAQFPAEFFELSQEDQDYVEFMVNSELARCSECGVLDSGENFMWHEHAQGEVCDSCYSICEEEFEEEDEQ
jgi:hypothetical protein